jgi:hypothetical protein
MKYICLVYLQESDIGEMSQDAWDALNAECIDYSESITRSGHRLGGEALEPTHTATDGPGPQRPGINDRRTFAETKEQLRASISSRRRTWTLRSRWPRGIPPARLGSIEIRPFVR